MTDEIEISKEKVQALAAAYADTYPAGYTKAAHKGVELGFVEGYKKGVEDVILSLLNTIGKDERK